MKKTKRLLCLFLAVFTFLAFGLTALAEPNSDDTDIETKFGITKDQVAQSVESWVTSLAQLSEEDFKQYPDDVMLTSWAEASEGAGAYVEVLGDEAVYEITEGGFTAEVPVKMENGTIVAKLDFAMESGGVEVVFENKEGSGMSLGQIFKKAGLNTLLGMGTVFLVLIFISILIWLLGFVPKLLQPKDTTVNQAAAADTPAAPLPVVERAAVDKADDRELAAVIAAAIAASTGTSTDSFVVRSIRKVKRS